MAPSRAIPFQLWGNITLLSRIFGCPRDDPRGACCAHYSNARALRPRKPKAHGHREQNFVDWRRVRVKGGNGGNGAISFLRLFCNPEAGPSGGDGGNGGHIIFEATRIVSSLAHVASEYRAVDGEKGGSNDCVGKSANHTIVQVPTGTVVKNENLHVVGDLSYEGDVFLAARGGAGGKGNQYFMTNANKAPEMCELGGTGESRLYVLEMKTIAHAGLIGFPNAGKSTLLRAISRARPKVASYPFTTLKPHIGIIQYDDYEQIAVADIPGLIPDAHLDRGLGIAFLKHIERCLCLIYVVDLSMSEPWIQLDILKKELDHYQAGLSLRPHVVIGNKIDLASARENLSEFKSRIDLPIIPVSAKIGINITFLLKHLRDLYDENLKDQFELV